MSKEQIEEMARTLLLKHHGIECFRNCIPCGKCTTYNYAETIYNAGYRKQEWISVDERLPNDGEIVLTISSEAEMEVCFYEAAWEGIFQQYHGLVKIFNITHWMPLPEPPMKGGAEE